MDEFAVFGDNILEAHLVLCLQRLAKATSSLAEKKKMDLFPSMTKNVDFTGRGDESETSFKDVNVFRCAISRDYRRQSEPNPSELCLAFSDMIRTCSSDGSFCTHDDRFPLPAQPPSNAITSDTFFVSLLLLHDREQLVSTMDAEYALRDRKRELPILKALGLRETGIITAKGKGQPFILDPVAFKVLQGAARGHRQQ